jgi:hypothetical protein
MTALSSTVEQGRHMHSNGAFVFTCTDMFINVRKSMLQEYKDIFINPKTRVQAFLAWIKV